ncbi:MAG: hypothetical protein ABFS86_11760 [Planctomycetota bacterium]
MKTLADALQLLHRGRAPNEALPDTDLRQVFAWADGVLSDLAKLHREGLYHGDVCPGAIRLRSRRARLVDNGAILAPIEYRDPDRERLVHRDPTLARRGEPRHDLYGVGASLFAAIDGGPPACGPCSPFTRPVARAVAYIVYRAMADGPTRYPTAKMMRADVRALLRHAGRGRFADVEPEKLPSFDGGRAPRAKSLSPFRPRHRKAAGRRPGVRLAAVVILAAAAATVGYRDRFFHPKPPEPQTAAAPAPRTGLPGLVDDWREKLGDRLRATGTHGLDTLDVQLLVLEDAPVRDDLRWPRHPSRSLARKVRTAIRDDDSGESVQEALLAGAPGDTLPAVLHVFRRGEERVARFYYRTLVWESGIPAG